MSPPTNALTRLTPTMPSFRATPLRPVLPLPSSPPPTSNRGFKMTYHRPQPSSSSATLSLPPRNGAQGGANGASGVAGGIPAGGGGAGAVRRKASPYGVLYREIVPAMLPIILISSSVFLSISLVRQYLSHSLSLTESSERIAQLEAELKRLRVDQKRQRERERKERERILPLVVERVLQRVGAMAGEGNAEDIEEEKLLV